MNALLVAALSSLLLAVLFVGWLVWLVSVQTGEPRPVNPEFAARRSARGDRGQGW
ncbi:hypothetical protein [Kitasatospora sp. SUK 42]|uniref:hypothetical protein n=1 Tax=Kitasatospora sp. SUK 42 TaxID=1588882 RepID=UPI0018CB10D0|nr:hypothetical protein [Kitasatospora sp. SUK 42]MBV2152665.1 hypothetical protein [Kitasatospora sp. SUK 42]